MIVTAPRPSTPITKRVLVNADNRHPICFGYARSKSNDRASELPAKDDMFEGGALLASEQLRQITTAKTARDFGAGGFRR